MSLIKIPDNCDIKITNDEEYLVADRMLGDYIDSMNNKETEIPLKIKQLVTLIELYQGTYVPNFSFSQSL